jgi:tetratricopeptide (TPR) repeat protein
VPDYDVDFLVDRLMEEEDDKYRPSPLESREQYLSRRRSAIENELDKTFSRALSGYSLIIQVLAEDPERDLEPFKVNTSAAENWDPEGPIILHELFGWSFNTVNVFYGVATEIFNKGQYEDALDALVFITTVCPRVADYWTALAITYETLGRNEEAEDAYVLALWTDPNNTFTRQAAIDFHNRLGRQTEAQALMEQKKESEI